MQSITFPPHAKLTRRQQSDLEHFPGLEKKSLNGSNKNLFETELSLLGMESAQMPPISFENAFMYSMKSLHSFISSMKRAQNDSSLSAFSMFYSCLVELSYAKIVSRIPEYHVFGEVIFFESTYSGRAFAECRSMPVTNTAPSPSFTYP